MNPWHLREIHDTVRFLASAWKQVDRLYIDPPRGLKGSLTDPKYLFGSFRWQVEPCGEILVYRPPLGFAPVFLGLRRLADRFAAAEMNRILSRRYGPAWRENVIIYISSWSYTQAGFVDKLNPKYLIFHILDDSFAFPLVKDYPRVLEENKLFYRYMMARSSIILAVSQELAQKYSVLYKRPVHLLKNGVDPAHFHAGGTQAAAPEMEKIGQPVLMYTGSINSWVDLPLLVRLAEDRPLYSLVLVGHYYGGTADAGLWQNLLDKPNVYWLKSKPYSVLPAYIRYASVLLLPRTEAEHSRASDPLKLYEYLSTGKPVVSTALPSVDEFREFVYVSGEGGFAAAVDTAIKERGNSLNTRQVQVMEKHSWAARIEEIGRILERETGSSF